MDEKFMRLAWHLWLGYTLEIFRSMVIYFYTYIIILSHEQIKTSQKELKLCDQTVAAAAWYAGKLGLNE